MTRRGRPAMLGGSDSASRISSRRGWLAGLPASSPLGHGAGSGDGGAGWVSVVARDGHPIIRFREEAPCGPAIVSRHTAAVRTLKRGQKTMFAHVERKHWWIQFPFSWGVEVVLVLALLAGTAFAAIQVGSRQATITDQAAVISQQAATIGRQDTAIQLSREQMGRVAAVDATIIAAYEQLAATQAWMAQTSREGNTEAGAYAADIDRFLLNEIELLKAQRQKLLVIPAGFDT